MNGGPRRMSRYELKYYVGIERLAALRDAFAARLDPDPLFPGGRNAVWSLYYDTPGLRCYWEKIDGESFRRKLRIRHYGDPWPVTADTPVWVEVKQRAARTTSKRRLLLPYASAERLCAGELPDGAAPGDQGTLDGQDRAFAEEVAGLVAVRTLQPTMMVGYVREAYEGGPFDDGLRVTFDVRLRGRDRDLHFGGDVTGDRTILDPSVFVLEIKVDERVPRWVTALIAHHDLTARPVSKYCRAVEAYGTRPRSVHHAPERRAADIQLPDLQEDLR